jgi:hypothetical protein
LDLSRQVFSDSWHILERISLRDRRDVLRQAFQGLRYPAVGSDPERVLVLDLQEIGDLVEQIRDLDVFHLG